MKKFPLSKRTIALFAAAGLLLAGGTTGSTTAALTARSEVYHADIQLSNIGVALVENGENVSTNNTRDEKIGELLARGDQRAMLAQSNDKYIPGVAYPEEIRAKNRGTVDGYVRIIITKKWVDENDVVQTQYGKDPELIQLAMTEDSEAGYDGHWIIDHQADTSERTILYYSKPLKGGKVDELGNVVEEGAMSAKLSTTLTVSPDVLTKEVTKTEGDGVVTITYGYDGMYVCLEAQVDIVQSAHAEDAILSAWGKDVTISEDGTLSLATRGGAN